MNKESLPRAEDRDIVSSFFHALFVEAPAAAIGFIMRASNTSERKLGDTERDFLAKRAEEDNMGVSPWSLIKSLAGFKGSKQPH